MAGLDDLRKTNRAPAWRPHKWDQQLPYYLPFGHTRFAYDEFFEALMCARALIACGAFEADQWDAIVDAKLREIRDRAWGTNRGTP